MLKQQRAVNMQASSFRIQLVLTSKYKAVAILNGLDDKWGEESQEEVPKPI